MALLDNLYLDSPIYGLGKHEIIVSRRVDLAHEKSEDAVEEHVDARYEAAGVDLDGHSPGVTLFNALKRQKLKESRSNLQYQPPTHEQYTMDPVVTTLQKHTVEATRSARPQEEQQLHNDSNLRVNPKSAGPRNGQTGAARHQDSSTESPEPAPHHGFGLSAYLPLNKPKRRRPVTDDFFDIPPDAPVEDAFRKYPEMEKSHSVQASYSAVIGGTGRKFLQAFT
ncbi:hypothetical protein MPH_12377 [Macrophomina phaseolina MS6]|uniref:Uncharacterized protein n=1 Tax=Macrophomina phaseolina (strain MS6) TaxID=1126212 RepID=K2RK72_MACPH|nr:hypothetical protein MPH_12377 [Macrophomina phaseolina MS6]